MILGEAVWTSDRKLRTFGVTEHLRLMLRSREHLGLWYDKRRNGK